MRITSRESDDPQHLRERINAEAKALPRDRYRAVLLAMEGYGGQELEGDQIAQALGRSPRFVDEWVGRYRRGGLASLAPRKQRGNRPALSLPQQEAFKARLLAGPTAADGVCTLRGVEARRILEVELGVPLQKSAVYVWMHRVGLSCLRPRPRHRKNDPRAVEEFKAHAPLLSGG